MAQTKAKSVKPQPVKNVPLRLSPAEYSALKRHADQDCRSLQSFVKVAVKLHIERQDRAAALGA